MSNRIYDLLKNFVIIGIPALATFISAVSMAWNLDPVITSNIVLTITALGTFLGTILKISTNKYNKDTEPNEKEIMLNETDMNEI